MNQVFNENCLDTMDLMLENSIDLVVTSPPYDNLRKYNGYDFQFEKIAKELYRIIKTGGVVVWVVGDATINGSETGSSFRQALFFIQCGFNLTDTMIWNKENVFGTAGNPVVRYQQAFEYIFVFTKGRIKTFNPILSPVKLKDKVWTGKLRRDRRSNITTDCLKVRRDIANKDFKVVNNIFTYQVGLNKTSKDRIAFEHPAIFPDQLATDMINSYSNIGDTVYDPFAGSGTTLKAAYLNGRKYIGSEISTEYCKIINTRLENTAL